MDSELKTKKKIFFVLFISIFSCMLGVGIIVPILPIYAETLGATGFWLGAIFAGFSLARSIACPLSGVSQTGWEEKGLFLSDCLSTPSLL